MARSRSVTGICGTGGGSLTVMFLLTPTRISYQTTCKQTREQQCESVGAICGEGKRHRAAALQNLAGIAALLNSRQRLGARHWPDRLGLVAVLGVVRVHAPVRIHLGLA